MVTKDVEKVLILGAGTMGSQISFDCLLAGYRVAVYDISERALQEIDSRHETFAFKWPGKKPMSLKTYKTALKNLETTSDPEKAGYDADLMIEAVFEDLPLKQKIFEDFEKICPESTILTSNTSQLLPSLIEERLGNKERFCVFHFNWPRTVVDIMGGTRTSPNTIQQLKDFAKSINYLPIVTKKEIPGAIHGVLFSQWVLTALSLAAGGYGSVEDIDRAWMKSEGGGFGPLASLDIVGLDTVQKIIENVAAAGSGPWDDFLKYIKNFTDKGHLGLKTGKGFYTYPDPLWSKPGFLDPELSSS